MRLIIMVGTVLFILQFLSCSTNPSVAGGSSTVDNPRVMASVRHANGSPAAYATVRLRRNTWVSQPPSLAKAAIYGADALTDSNGRFEISGINPGSYRIEVTDGRSAVLFACSLDERDSIDLGAGTLRSFAAITGIIDTAGHANDLLYAQVPGLQRLVAANAAGAFVMNDLPAGTYSVQVVSSHDTGIIVKRDSIVAQSGKTIVLPLLSRQFFKSLIINTTASGANISEDVTGFPLLVRLDDVAWGSTQAAANFFSQARDSGQDIRFTKADGSPIAYEIEQWDSFARSAVIWVRVDTVYGNNDHQFINMFWGALAGSSPVSLSKGAAVFDTADGFAGVWQMNGTGPVVQVNDQTLRSANGHAQGAWAATSRQAGIIGGALQFNGVDNALVMQSGLPRLTLGNATISMWLRTTSSATQPIVSYQNDAYRLRVAMENRIWFGLLPATGTWIESPLGAVQTPLLADGAWHRVTVAYQRTSYARLFVDGRLVDSLSISSAAALDMAADSMVVGYDNFMLAYFSGTLDEVRYETTIRPAAYEKLCYENQRKDQAVVMMR